jgi:Fic family protein
MEALGFELRTSASVTALTTETVRSSAIEGERLDAAEVRSSIARRLGLDVAGLPEPSRAVDGIVEVMLDATRNFDQPLTAERLHAWHAALFPTGRSGMHRITVGAWRTGEAGPMRIVSGPVGKERIHFVAPDADRLEVEMDLFLRWFNKMTDLDPVLKAGVAHLWFVTVHPFDDGNGRIARAITDLALSRADGSKERYYSMSSSLEAERRDYHVRLESAQRGSLDITAWLAWFFDCLDRAIDASDIMLAAILRRARIWQSIAGQTVNDRQRKVINRMLEPDWQGNLKTSKYARLATCSVDTALRDIKELLEHGILVRNEGGGRSTSYRLADPEAP